MKLAYNTKELAEATGINRKLINQYREEGKLKAVKCGNIYYFHIDEVKRFFETYSGCELSTLKKAGSEDATRPKEAT